MIFQIFLLFGWKNSTLFCCFAAFLRIATALAIDYHYHNVSDDLNNLFFFRDKCSMVFEYLDPFGKQNKDELVLV